ncbi:DUF3332 domain-containing protein [Robertkochia solimangrovi]|uniref:DUF3332 domain-containing protein n=1 Tax=Robertkochia solimangrovi TaxID=2213046 RepID=UPI001180CCA6|nr:DUF3332 domain-containing protein [Robertkochia solimangrovi]TRZ45795.1 hypothetical protein DMZ48_00510 [Robertkochia solimangrovi]
MKRIALCSAMALSVLFTSCLGSFSAFNNLRDWNQGISDSKFINNLVFWGLLIIPVYEIFLLGDVIIFNVLEFWTGSNPIAMKEGESETQYVKYENNTYKMTATQNRMQIKVVEGPKTGEMVDLVYRPDEKSWNAVKANGEIIKLSSFDEGFYIVYMPDGSEIRIQENATREEGKSMLEEYKQCFYLDGMYAEGK